MRRSRITIKVRVIAAMVLMLVVSMLVVVTYITSRNASEARETGFAYADEVARESGGQIQQVLLSGLGTGRDMGAALNALSATGGSGSRKVASAQLRAVLEAHDDYLGTWTGWEANAFDGRDRGDEPYRHRRGVQQRDVAGRSTGWPLSRRPRRTAPGPPSRRR